MSVRLVSVTIASLTGAMIWCLGVQGSGRSPTLRQPQALQFEVATIKPHSQEQDRRNGMAFSGGSCHGVDKQYQPGSPIAPPPLGRCVFQRVSLSSLITLAYKVSVSGGPDWASSDFFDVEGKAENVSEATEGQLLAMLQTLTAERFKIQFHQEERQVQGYNLYAGKGRPNLKESVGDDPPRVRFGPGPTCTVQHATMSYFANSIRGVAKGPVTDKTGLTAAYDFSFQWVAGDPESFLSEMQAQLGLRAEAVKIPTQFFIIDHAEKPIEQ